MMVRRDRQGEREREEVSEIKIVTQFTVSGDSVCINLFVAHVITCVNVYMGCV